MTSLLKSNIVSEKERERETERYIDRGRGRETEKKKRDIERGSRGIEEKGIGQTLQHTHTHLVPCYTCPSHNCNDSESYALA